MRDWLGDFRYAFRTLRKNRSATIFAVLALALGIGANTAAFGVLNAMLYRRVPAVEPERLVAVRAGAFGDGDDRMPMETYERIAAASRTLSGTFGWRGDYPLVNIEANGSAFAGLFGEVTAGYFDALGVRPRIGRLLSAEDAGRDVAVLDYRCWERRFGRAPSAIGSTVRVGARLLTIVGVAPREFTGVEVEVAPDVIAPFARSSGAKVAVVGRLSPGANIAAAQAEMDLLWTSLASGEWRVRRVRVESVATGVSYARGRKVGPIVAIVALAGLLLLLACANLANFMLARAASRQREMDMRVSLGAGAWRIVRLLLAEAACLASAAAVLGIAFAYWAGPKLFALWWTGITPTVVDARPDARVLAVSIAATAACALLFGLAPARTVLRGSRRLGSSSRGLHGSGATRLFVSAQVALSLVLVGGSLLLVQTVANLRSADLGFRRDGLLLMRLFPRDPRTEFPDRTGYYRELAERLAAIPGVQKVSFSAMAPLAIGQMRQTVRAADAAPEVDCARDMVGPGFFESMGINVVAGREFAWSDSETSPRVAIVSQALAERLFPGQDAVGRSVRMGPEEATVVGVVKDARLWKPRGETPPAVFTAVMQDAGENQFTVDVRTAGDPVSAGPACRRVLAEMGRHVALSVDTIRQHENRIWSDERVLSSVSSLLGALAVLLAAVGVYATTAFSVARRVSEIGVRVALGAQRRHVFALVLGETAAMTGTGVALGVPLAIGSFRVLKNSLYGVSASDPATLACTAAALGVVALAAAYFPARRATRIDPATALRAE